jgi:hypothetical protein
MINRNIGDSRVNGVSRNTYGENKELNCKDCLWIDSCEKQLRHEVNIAETASGVDSELEDMYGCEEFLNANYDSNFLELKDINIDEYIENNRQDYINDHRNDYYTYTREFN